MGTLDDMTPLWAGYMSVNGYPRLPGSEGNLVLHVSDVIRARECL